MAREDIKNKLEGTPTCPFCQSIIDGFTGIDHEKNMREGDVSICVYCSGILQLTENNTFIPIEEETFSKVLASEHRDIFLQAMSVHGSEQQN